ncbi:MAG: hypothetical protein GXP27_13365 [Planctomycetes bacterium]|nr:hypothetical protein [Planctomycetota bacterium]
MTEITIAPDGRVFLFGTSREVLEALSQLTFRDADLDRRLNRIAKQTPQTGPHAGGLSDSQTPAGCGEPFRSHEAIRSMASKRQSSAPPSRSDESE